MANRSIKYQLVLCTDTVKWLISFADLTVRFTGEFSVIVTANDPL